jgi:hypothetical protein
MSSERSGSNLVREMLNAHPNISAPPAAQLPRLLTAYRPYYGDLSVDANMMRMIADAIAINKSHPEQIDITTSVSDIFKLLEERSVWGLISTLYSLNATEQGKTAWASKDNFLFDFAFEIKCTLPNAYFIYLFRDGRDYACSMKRVGLSNLHVFHIARQWQDEQQACLRAYYSFKEKGWACLLRYEDLIADPEVALSRVCEFLGEPFREEMLNYHGGGSAKKLASQSAFWENLSKPVIKDNYAKFKQELSLKDIALFEAVAGMELVLLGYPRMSATPVREPSVLLRLWYGMQNGIAKYIRLKNLNKREPWRKPRTAVMKKILANLKSNPAISPVIEPIEYT